MTAFQLPKLLVLALAVLGFSLATAAPALALDIPKGEVARLGKAVTEAAHWSGVDPRVADYSFRGDSLYMTVKYEGAVSGITHTANVRIDVDPNTGRVKSYDFRDVNNLIAPDYNKIERELARCILR